MKLLSPIVRQTISDIAHSRASDPNAIGSGALGFQGPDLRLQRALDPDHRLDLAVVKPEELRHSAQSARPKAKVCLLG